MPTLVRAEGDLLDRVLDGTYPVWHDGLTRSSYGKFYRAQTRTVWGEGHLRMFALVDGDRLLASVKRYDLTAVVGGTRTAVCGLGAVFTDPAYRGRGHAAELIEGTLSAARADGAAFALLFSEIGADYYARLAFDVVPAPAMTTMRVAESPRYGAPMTMIRAGDQRDLNAIAAMGRSRAEPAAFHLDRDPDFIQYGISKKRLLAGLGRSGERELHFFIAEEGITAAAYVVIGVSGSTWTIEECGDRDPTGARVGAILQALIARQPAERRASIGAWLPHGFVPPQVTLSPPGPDQHGSTTDEQSERPSRTTGAPAPRPATHDHDQRLCPPPTDHRASTELMMMRSLVPGRTLPRLSAEDVLYWRIDLF